MAELDTSIYGGVRPKSFFDYAAEMDQADANKAAKEQNRLALLIQQGQFQDQQAARQRGNALRQALQGLGAGATDDQRIGVLESHGEFGQADTLRKGALERQKTAAQVAKDQAAAKASELQSTAKQIDLVLQAVSAARDQPSYTRSIQFLQANGIDTSNIPPQFDPQAVASFGQMALTAKERLDQQLKQQTFEQSARNDLIGPDGQVNQPLLNAKRQVASAGKTTVSVNTGQKGFENEMKLRDDFKQEPIYKAHQEVQSAYQQIKSALGQKSPAGDLAGATKIMKLLDPGSVVRESELGMAMAASGLMDRISNYAQMTMSGQKLTPTQRQDFQALADKLHAASVEQFNTKRSEYEKIGSEYGLNAPRALGPEVKKQTNQVLKFDANGNPVQQ